MSRNIHANLCAHREGWGGAAITTIRVAKFGDSGDKLRVKLDTRAADKRRVAFIKSMYFVRLPLMPRKQPFLYRGYCKAHFAKTRLGSTRLVTEGDFHSVEMSYQVRSRSCFRLGSPCAVPPVRRSSRLGTLPRITAFSFSGGSITPVHWCESAVA